MFQVRLRVIRIKRIFRFLFFSKKIADDSTDLNLKIIYLNKGNQIDSIYKYFIEGDRQDEDKNINTEKFKEGRYKHYGLRYYQKINQERPSDKCDDLPKKIINPQKSDTVVFNLLKAGGVYEEGKYRFKAFVRTGCVINGRGTHYNPIDPDIKYAESKWIYFEVKKLIFKAPEPLR